MTVYFAWVDLVGGAAPAFSGVHEVQDEDVFAFEVVHSEGDFPQMTLDVRNTGGGLLAPGRKRWAWLSRDMGAGAVPLFFGRLVGTPEDVARETQRLYFIARASDWATQKETLAESLRTLPHYDPVWLAEDSRGDPDIVLQARSALWHTDRLTGALTVSDYSVGESGPATLNHFRDGLQFRFSTAASRRVKVKADALWQQEGTGSVDITGPLMNAFQASGSSGRIASYTGEGLIRSWPDVGARIGGGWSVGDVSLRRVDGASVRRRYLEVATEDGSFGRFPQWEIKGTMAVDFDVARAYGERVEFILTSDIQPLVVGADEDEAIEINLSSSAVGEPIDEVIPIGDLRRRSYYQSDRGQLSLTHLLLRARAILRAEARAVEVAVDVPFAEAAALTCRHSATVSDARLPGGTATGKVVEYRFGIDGDTGVAFGAVTLGCTIGKGGAVDAGTSAPVYVVDGYVVDGWQAEAGGVVLAPETDTGWEWGDREINDDGVDLFTIAADVAVISIAVTNGVTAQKAAMNQTFPDLAAAAARMNEVPTRVALEMLPIDGSGFSTEYTLTTQNLVLPKTIDLEAA